MNKEKQKTFGAIDNLGPEARVPFDDWWREVCLHAAARGIDIDHDQESYRESWEDGLQPWEAVEG